MEVYFLTAPGSGRQLLVEGPGFVIERVQLGGGAVLRPAADRPVWMAVVGGQGVIDGSAFGAGDVWMAHDAVGIDGDAELLLAYAGGVAMPNLWVTR